MNKVPFRQLQNLAFSIYSPHQIRKLSVLEITNPNTFDALEHPNAGGLYDSHLGPSDQDEVCATCGLRAMYCPGHVGHITLPLPVFNPVFIKTLYQLLQGSCFSCHRVMAPVSAVNLILCQFQALEYGLVGTVHELAESLMNEASVVESSDDPSGTHIIEAKLRAIIARDTAGLNLEQCKSTAQVKSVVECKQRIMQDFIRTHLTKGKPKCFYCDARKIKIALRNNNRFVFNVGKKDPIKARITKNLQKKNVEVESDDIQSNVNLTPVDAKAHLEQLWNHDRALLRNLFGILDVHSSAGECPMHIFFTEILIVPPTRFRPLSVVKGRKYMNPQSVALKEVLNDVLSMRSLLKIMKGVEVDNIEQANAERLPGKTYSEKMNSLWLILQMHVNFLYDSDLDKMDKTKAPSGVKQVLEKKEGLLRKHMMGKRVNYAARSVISPDLYITVDEIGIPEVFAKKLTYPTPVSDWNVEMLRTAVMNGPNVHPGADKVETEDGRVIKLSPTDAIQRQSIACMLLTPPPSAHGVMKGIPKKVHRHLRNGDILLLNRQPTLHKPSIMAHRARVLPGEKTLRLHYANCKSYNADFDGDEMNAHFPQSELSHAEGHFIVSVNNQYLVPKDGTPLSGLIQDHIVGATLLTMRGKFFTREDYHQLVYGAISFVEKSVKTLPPAIMKPTELWSGKQVVSTVIINVLPEGKSPPVVEGKAKVSSKNWQNAEPREWIAGGTPLEGDAMSESEVIIRHGELLCGVLDKGQIGPTPLGLIHCCYELYGGKTSSALITAFGRLFTVYLQIHRGFTVGIDDFLLTDEASKKRRKVMHKAKKVGDGVVAEAFDADNPEDKEEVLSKFIKAHLSRDDIGLKTLDYEMKKCTDTVNNDINGICMPDGLLKKFPYNNLQLMVQTGAKGSTVNAMQISCLLGQIELEGRRVPLMLNGSTLPMFLPYDTSPRAGGFVDGRFLTGIKAPEFFFHCMAGREGLVDTAVKTSRSGYLQRCLIKHLEGLTVNYDLTVRDSDGSVIQFLYGEDGLDVSKMQLLKEGRLHALAANYDAVINEQLGDDCTSQQELENLEEHKASIVKWERKYRNKISKKRWSGFHNFVAKGTHASAEAYDTKSLVDMWHHLEVPKKMKFSKRIKKCPDPANSKFRPDLVYGAISEKLDAIMRNYIDDNHHGILCHAGDYHAGSQPKRFLQVDKFEKMVHYHAMNSLAQPGEAVGLLAAQSIGEPSTQMTLNTFHFAGRGEMNVTLGIPRLREILMVASAKIATPTMDLPLLNRDGIEKEAGKLKMRLSAVHLKQVLESIEITETLFIKSRSNRFRHYTVHMRILPHKAYSGVHYTTPLSILHYIEQLFIQRVIVVVKKKLADISSSKLLSSVDEGDQGATPDDPGAEDAQLNLHVGPLDTGDRASSDEEDGNDGDTVAAKVKSRHNQDLEYEEPELDEKPHETDEEEIEESDENCGEGPKKEEHEDSDQNCSVPQENADAVLAKILRVKRVCDKYRNWISHYDYDAKKMLWCEFTLRLELENSKIDMQSLVEDEASTAIVYRVPNIKKAFLVKNPKSKSGAEKMIKTDGVNFLEVFKYVNIIDTSRIYSNDIHAIAKIYGIEAAARVIVKEIANVFGIYGIDVDPRHLLLVADYMTFDGTYKPCNRIGMASSASPLQQMTFETTMSYLQSATLKGSKDQLKSPSSRLVVGQVVANGTGFFDLFLKPHQVPHKKSTQST